MFSLNTTLEAVIRHIIKVFELPKRCYDFVLKYILINKTKKINLDYPLSTNLHQLNLGTHAFMSFQDRAEENVEESSSGSKPITSTSQLSIKITYLKNNSYRHYRFSTDKTIENLFSFLMKEFHLENENPSHLELELSDRKINLINSGDKKLVELGIGSKYQSARLSLKPYQSVITVEHSVLPKQSIEVHRNSYVIVRSWFSNEILRVDLSTIRTLIDLKQKILDLFTQEKQQSFPINDISLSLNDKTFTQSDNHCALHQLGIHDSVTIQAQRLVSRSRTTRQSESTVRNSRSKSLLQDRSNRPEIQTYQLSKRINLIGLYNLRNTCYLNSVLQCLAHVNPLTSFFQDELLKLHSNSGDKSNTKLAHGDLTSAYMEFIRHMWIGELKVFVPHDIFRILGSMAPQFSTYGQQDAQECMIFLLNSIHHEIEKRTNNNSTIIKQLFHSTIQSKTTCLQCNRDPKITSNTLCFLPISLTQRKRSFEIYFTSNRGESTCYSITILSNGSIKDLVDQFVRERGFHWLDLRIFSHKNPQEEFPMERLLENVPEDKIRVTQIGYKSPHSTDSCKSQQEETCTLDWCIRQFLSPEIMENAWLYNHECNGRKFKKEIIFKSLAPVLIIYLKRFTDENGNMRKIETKINFPINDFDLKMYCPDLMHDHSNMIYDLIAVSNHFGSVSVGHYTTYARINPDSPWYRFNDDKVTLVSNLDDIVSRDAYILIYLRRAKSSNNSEVCDSHICINMNATHSEEF